MVQYTVKADYAETNSENINEVMKDLRNVNNPEIKYSTFLLDDKKSFVHVAMFSSAEAEAELSQLESFKQFQSLLKTSVPEVLPQVKNINLVGSSYELFG